MEKLNGYCFNFDEIKKCCFSIMFGYWYYEWVIYLKCVNVKGKCYWNGSWEWVWYCGYWNVKDNIKWYYWNNWINILNLRRW